MNTHVRPLSGVITIEKKKAWIKIKKGSGRIFLEYHLMKGGVRTAYTQMIITVVSRLDRANATTHVSNIIDGVSLSLPSQLVLLVEGGNGMDKDKEEFWKSLQEPVNKSCVTCRWNNDKYGMRCNKFTTILQCGKMDYSDGTVYFTHWQWKGHNYDDDDDDDKNNIS